MPDATEPFSLAASKDGRYFSATVASADVAGLGALQLGALIGIANATRKPAKPTAGAATTVLGFIDETKVDDVSGDVTIRIRRGVITLKNSATNPLTTADLFGKAYVEDDTTAHDQVGTCIAGELVAIRQLADGSEVVDIDTTNNLLRADL